MRRKVRREKGPTIGGVITPISEPARCLNNSARARIWSHGKTAITDKRPVAIEQLFLDGVYDAKAGSGSSKDKKGFVPGGMSLHSCMSAHGPDAVTFEKASNGTLAPHYFDGGLAFMFESTLMMKLTDDALDGEHLDRDYYKYVIACDLFKCRVSMGTCTSLSLDIFSHIRLLPPSHQ